MLKTVSLALGVLKMFTREKPEWGGRELAAELEENHTKIYRILETLEQHRYLTKDPVTKKYALGLAIWELGNELTEKIGINKFIRPTLSDISAETNESVFFTVLDKDEGLTLDAVEGKSNIRFSVSIGSRTPLYAGASYRAILAHLSDEYINQYISKGLKKYTKNTINDSGELLEEIRKIRESGIAISTGEYTEDVVAVAVPIFINSKVIGSLTVSGPSYRINDEQIQFFEVVLMNGKKKLEEVLEGMEYYFQVNS